MNPNDIHDIVTEIFTSLFPSLSDSQLAQLNRLTSDQWDSMQQVNLVTALESEFDIALSMDDAMKIDSFASCLKTVEAQLTA